MQVSEITSLGAGMLKSFTEHNQLRQGLFLNPIPIILLPTICLQCKLQVHTKQGLL